MNRELIERARKLKGLLAHEGFSVLAKEINERMDIASQYCLGKRNIANNDKIVKWQGAYNALDGLKAWLDDEIKAGEEEYKQFLEAQTTREGSSAAVGSS
jgi:hypothetical protein